MHVKGSLQIMNHIKRICPHCGEGTSLDARFCDRCGADQQGELPLQRRSLPASVGRAALPVLAGVATLALRTGWKLLSNHLHQSRESASPEPRPNAQVQSQPQARSQSGRTIRIRSSWIVGDAQGNWQKGSSEHVIDVD